MQQPVVTQILGCVAAPGADVQGSPAENNTRWIADISLRVGQEVDLTLLTFRGRKPLTPDLVSAALLPLNEDFWSARPVFDMSQPGRVRILCKGTPVAPDVVSDVVASFRLSVDCIHSATR
jgi:hypothetical protein